MSESVAEENLSKFGTRLKEIRLVLGEIHGTCRDDNPTHPKHCDGCL